MKVYPMIRLREYIAQLEAIAQQHGDLPLYATSYGETYQIDAPEMVYRYAPDQLKTDAVQLGSSCSGPFEQSVYSTVGENDSEMLLQFHATYVEKCVLVAGR